MNTFLDRLRGFSSHWLPVIGACALLGLFLPKFTAVVTSIWALFILFLIIFERVPASVAFAFFLATVPGAMLGALVLNPLAF